MNKKRKQEPKVSVKLVGLGVELNLAKVAKIKMETEGKGFIYLTQMKSGNWHLAYTDDVVPDIKKLEAL